MKSVIDFYEASQLGIANPLLRVSNPSLCFVLQVTLLGIANPL
jgi:hypothetical protein